MQYQLGKTTNPLGRNHHHTRVNRPRLFRPGSKLQIRHHKLDYIHGGTPSLEKVPHENVPSFFAHDVSVSRSVAAHSSNR